jgi:hypothetical protein
MERLIQVGIEQPEWNDEPKSWAFWWDVITLEKTDCERQELRTLLELPDWSENPFTLTSIHLDSETIHLSYTVPFEVLNEVLTRLELPLPIFPESHGAGPWSLVHWWDKNAPRMTDEQKAALWRLLDPQPWEIVEVELEGAP